MTAVLRGAVQKCDTLRPARRPAIDSCSVVVVPGREAVLRRRAKRRAMPALPGAGTLFAVAVDRK